MDSSNSSSTRLDQLGTIGTRHSEGRRGPREKCLALLDEARQLARILAQIVITSKLRSEDSGEDPEPPEKGKPKPKRKPKPKT